MKKQALLPIIFLISIITSAQNVLKSDALYADQTPMEIKLSYSNKEVNKNTNDTTFIKTSMEFLHEGKWASIDVRLRARGNFRRAECYFPPIKMKIKKDQYKGTIFDGNKTMKLVLPCKLESENNDNILLDLPDTKDTNPIKENYTISKKNPNLETFRPQIDISSVAPTDQFNKLQAKTGKMTAEPATQHEHGQQDYGQQNEPAASNQLTTARRLG